MAGEIRGFEAALGAQTRNADVVIVGTGPGGAGVGRALAEAGARVIYLEEGPAQSNFRPNMAHTNRYHMQEGGGMIARANTTVMMPVAAGRGVGGGSLVNSAICFRTPDHVLNGWIEALAGDDRYAPAKMAPVFEEVEQIIGVTRTAVEVAGENNMIIVRGAEKLGFPGGLVNRNAPGCQGCAQCNYGCPVLGKQSVDRNLLPMAIAAGAQIQADVKVTQILTEGGRAVGVRGVVRHPDTGEIVGDLTVRAPRVVICAGGVGTPRLLHHAGVAAQLGPAVGRGLHMHPGNAVLGLCDHEVKMWTGATQGAFFEHPDLPGVLPHTMSVPPSVLLLLLGKVGLEAKESLHTLARICGCVVMISDKGDGTVGATREGRAELTYQFDDGDIGRIKEGMRETARVLLEGGAKQVFAPVHGVGVHDSVESFVAALADRRIEDFSLYASHPMASCRMGSDPQTSVVDADAQAHRMPGLFVADSSVFPTSLGVNPQLTTMTLATMIGRKMATMC